MTSRRWVPTTSTLPAWRWTAGRRSGISPSFAEPQYQCGGTFVKMGLTPTISCTPYVFPLVPWRGDDSSTWSESSAVAFANSVLGAADRRQGGPSAAGGCHCRSHAGAVRLSPRQRAPRRRGHRGPPSAARGAADFGALSTWLASRWQRLPLVREPGRLSARCARSNDRGRRRGDRAETLGAGLAAYGAVALYHVVGLHARSARSGRNVDQAGRRASCRWSTVWIRALPDRRRPGAAPDRPGGSSVLRVLTASLNDWPHCPTCWPASGLRRSSGSPRAPSRRTDRAREAGCGMLNHRSSPRLAGRGRHLRSGGPHAQHRHHQHGHHRPRQDGLYAPATARSRCATAAWTVHGRVSTGKWAE